MNNPMYLFSPKLSDPFLLYQTYMNLLSYLYISQVVVPACILWTYYHLVLICDIIKYCGILFKFEIKSAPESLISFYARPFPHF